MQRYTIGQLAAAVGVNVETIRYYQRRKLLPEPRRTHGRVRRYGNDEIARLRFIRSAQGLGFTLSEIDELLELLEPRSCSKTRRIAAAKLAVIDERIGELQKLRTEFAALLEECAANSDEARCPIIEHLVR